MSFGPNDSGVLEFKTAEEASEYIEELGPKFKYGCRREGNPVQCHSLARWYASYKLEYAKSEEVFHENCFRRKFSESCMSYAFYKIFGAHGIKRDVTQAVQALKFGCHEGENAQCCQKAGELLLEGAMEHKKQSVLEAIDLFTLGCDRGLATSCFYLGGVLHRQAALEAAGRPSSAREAELRRSAVAAWVRACELDGHALACRNAARAFRLGTAVPKDETKAAAFDALANEATLSKPSP